MDPTGQLRGVRTLDPQASYAAVRASLAINYIKDVAANVVTAA